MGYSGGSLEGRQGGSHDSSEAEKLMPCDFILSDLPDMEQLSHTVFFVKR